MGALIQLTEKVAGLIKQLRDHKFDRIGGLYLESVVKRGTSSLDDTENPVFAGE